MALVYDPRVRVTNQFPPSCTNIKIFVQSITDYTSVLTLYDISYVLYTVHCFSRPEIQYPIPKTEFKTVIDLTI